MGDLPVFDHNLPGNICVCVGVGQAFICGNKRAHVWHRETGKG